MVAGPVGGLASQWTGIQQAFGAADRIFALLDTEPDVRDLPGAAPIGPVRGEIEFDAVSFKYGEGPLIFESLSTVFGEGKTTALEIGRASCRERGQITIVSRPIH